MENSLLEISIEDILSYKKNIKSYNKQVLLDIMEGSNLNNHNAMKDIFMRLDAFSIFIIRRGRIEITIDNKTYNLNDNHVLHIMDMHVIKNIKRSEDFKGFHLIIDRDLFCEIMLRSRKLPPSCVASLHDRPIQSITEEEGLILEKCLERLLISIDRNNHAWQSDLVKNDLRGFMLEMSNIIYQANKDKIRVNPSGKDMLLFLFIQLVNTHCKEQHEVNFYARELGITPEYLSRILKYWSDKTATQWISEAILKEAEMRLQIPGNSIQSISDQLNFSDQSSFGKFFKKHKGISPLQYKKEQMESFY